MLNKNLFLKILKRTLFLLLVILVLFLNIATVRAKDIDPRTGAQCRAGIDNCLDVAGESYDCTKGCIEAADGSKLCYCEFSPVKTSFGKVKAPGPLLGFLKADPTGTGAISNFLSNLVALMFSLAGIVFIFMLIWGAFDWLMSGGDKEKISSAQKKIINAIIGLILFAIAFAVIRLLGIFTGFTFFK